MRVLIIEDDRMARAVTGRLLRGAGFDVREADSVRSALDAIDDDVDCVVLDLTLAETAGVETVWMLSPLPIVVLTADTRPETVQAVAGFPTVHGYLVKGTPPEALVCAVEFAIHKARSVAAPSLRLIRERLKQLLEH
jgi:DNA-binding response OmpR family regulator